MKQFKRFLKVFLNDLLDGFFHAPKRNFKEHWEMTLAPGALMILCLLGIIGWLPASFSTFTFFSQVIVVSSAISICVMIVRIWQYSRNREESVSIFKFSTDSGSLVKKLTPESIGELIQFFLPPKIRKECFEPYFEELKEDRIIAAALAKSPCYKFWVEVAFLFRLVITFLQSFVCWFWKIFPLGEILRSIFKTGQ